MHKYYIIREHEKSARGSLACRHSSPMTAFPSLAVTTTRSAPWPTIRRTTDPADSDSFTTR